MKGRSLLSIVRRAVAPARGRSLVLGLSGGPDSVALLDVLERLRDEEAFTLVAAHFDHRLRADSAADREFCGALCAARGVELVTGSAAVRDRAERDHGGLEEAARIERYAFLRGVKRERGAAFLAVAHTRDDQAETFLLRLLRGSGTSGLAAMRPASGDLLRPFLEVSRAEILRHLDEQGLSFREDPSNADPLFLRNRVRGELLPALERRFNPRIREGLARTASLLADEDALLAEEGRKALDSFGRREEGAVHLSLPGLRGLHPALGRRMVRAALEEAGGLRGVGSSHVEKILEVAHSPAPSGRRLPLPGGREAVFSFEGVRLSPARPLPAPFLLPLSVPGRVVSPSGLAFTARSYAGPPVSNPFEAVVTTEEGGSLVVRSPRPGDRVRMGGKARRLNRVFMERRVPRDLRGGYPVVASGDEVLFVPGETLDPTEAPAGASLVRIAVAP